MTVPDLKTKDVKLEKPKNSKKKKEVIIRVKDLKTYYPIFGGLFKRKTGEVKAVDGVSFNFYKNETLGLVGESGCGKTTIGNTILNLVPNTDGEIYYENRRIDRNRKQGLFERIAQRYRNFYTRIFPIISTKQKEKFDLWMKKLPLIETFRFMIVLVFSFLASFAITLSIFSFGVIMALLTGLGLLIILGLVIIVFSRDISYDKTKVLAAQIQKDLMIDKFIRKRIQMVFQDPDASLNPRWKVVNIIGEPLKILEGMRKRRRIRKRVLELLEVVSLKREHLDRYPHEFSGGQKQRIVIARALACNPQVIVLDEPTSALDVSVQAQILNLLKELQKKFNLSFLFITHDLSVVQHIADRIAVMYLGRFVETGTIEEVFYNPTHPYTVALLSARPTFDPSSKSNRIILKGDVPSPINPPKGCAFHPRCPDKDKHIGCGIDAPRKIHLGGDHYIMCLPFKEEEKKSYEGRQYISD